MSQLHWLQTGRCQLDAAAHPNADAIAWFHNDLMHSVNHTGDQPV